MKVAINMMWRKEKNIIVSDSFLVTFHLNRERERELKLLNRSNIPKFPG